MKKMIFVFGVILNSSTVLALDTSVYCASVQAANQQLFTNVATEGAQLESPQSQAFAKQHKSVQKIVELVAEYCGQFENK